MHSYYESQMESIFLDIEKMKLQQQQQIEKLLQE